MIFVPKLVTSLKNYDRKHFIDDLLAGLVVGVVAVPLALAFGIASGVTPAQGLYTAVIGGLLVSLLGGSRVQIAGPTGAFVVIVYGIISQYGYEGLALCTVMAGVILIIMGLSGMGGMIKFIPYPVVTGFTSGIAVIIFSSQVKDFLGLEMPSVPVEFLEKWKSYVEYLGTMSWETAALAAGTLLVLIVWPRVTKKIPAPIVALIGAVAAARFLHLPVETIGSRFGNLPRGLPTPAWPQWQWSHVAHMVRPATVVAILAAIESLLSAVVSDGMIGSRHRSGMELVAQGVANLASPLFLGIPVTGAIARTATNVKSGGRTPVAGIIHALFLFGVLLFLGPLISMVPLCALAAILIVVSYHMSEWHSFLALLKTPRSDVVVLLTTFALTVLIDLTVAVEVGMVLAAFLFMRRMAEVTNVEAIVREIKDPQSSVENHVLEPEKIPQGVEIYQINGPFFFGAASKLGETMVQIEKAPKVFILRMNQVPVMDASGLRALRDFQSTCRRLGTILVISGIRRQPLDVIRKAGSVGHFDEIISSASLDDALAFARKSLATT